MAHAVLHLPIVREEGMRVRARCFWKSASNYGTFGNNERHSKCSECSGEEDHIDCNGYNPIIPRELHEDIHTEHKRVIPSEVYAFLHRQ